MAKHVSQIKLIHAIGRALDRQGFKDAAPRQLNAIVRAANLIVEEFEKPVQLSVPGSGWAAWRNSDDTGLSSLAMASRLLRAEGSDSLYVRPEDQDAHPHDPEYFGRCVRLLEACPELRPHIPAMADVSPVWARLVAVWDELEALYRLELPKGRAPMLYARMRELIEQPAQETNR